MSRCSIEMRSIAMNATLAILAACSTLRPAPAPTNPSPSKPVPAAIAPTVPVASAATADSPAPTGEVPVPMTANAASAAAAAPLCTPAQPTSKRNAKRKTKVEHREPPTQLVTAPTVAETPPGGVVDAEVKPMSTSVMSILGKRVQGPKGEDMGRVVDVLADATGRVRVAIIDFGGFLGVGDRRIAVDWPLLRFNADDRDPSLLLSVSRRKLQEAPEYKDTRRPQTLMEPAMQTPK